MCFRKRGQRYHFEDRVHVQNFQILNQRECIAIKFVLCVCGDRPFVLHMLHKFPDAKINKIMLKIMFMGQLLLGRQ